MVLARAEKKEPELLPGLALLCTSVMNESGFGGIDKDQLEDALAGRDVNIHFQADEGNFFIQGSAGPEEIPLVFQLVRNYFLDPAFSASALDPCKGAIQTDPPPAYGYSRGSHGAYR